MKIASLRNQAFFRRVFQAHPLPMWLWDPGTRAVLAVNDAALRAYGYSRREFLAMKAGAWRVGSSRPEGGLERHRGKSGRAFQVHTVFRTFALGGRRVVLEIAQEAGQLHRTFALLAAREAELRATLYSIGDAVISTDAAGRITRMNPVAEKLTGWREAEAQGRSLKEIFPIFNEHTRAAVRNPVERVLKEGVVVGLANHTVLVARDGRELPIADAAAPIRDASGRMTGVVLVFRDQTEERRAARALQESEAYARAMVESALDAVIGIDHTGRVVEFNPAAERLFGYSRAEAIGRDMAELIIPPALRERHRRGLKRHLVTGESAILGRRFEMPAHRKDRSEILVELAIARTDVEGRPRFTAYLRNVTEQRRAQEVLQESERRYRALFEANPHPMWIYDLETLRFLAVNDAAVDRYGWRREEFLAMTIRDIRPPEETPRLLSAVAEAGLGGLYRSGVWRHLRKDGSVMLVEVSSHYLEFEGRPARAVLVNDVTEQVRAREALQESEERFRLLARVTNDALWDWDLKNNTLWWSEGFEALFGFRRDEIESTIDSWITRIHPDDTSRVLEGIYAVIDGDGLTWSDEYRFLRKDGSFAHVLDRGYVIRDAAGKPLRMIGGMTDFTQHKVAEARIEQLAFYDSLTGLPNRALLLDRLKQALAAAERRGDRVALLFLDLNRFKEINDTQGHATGDDVLLEVARRLRTTLRQEETVARIGGDEFLVVAPGADQAGVMRIAERIQQALVQPLIVRGQAFSVGASIGIAFYPDDGSCPDELLKNTDIAMYRAKADKMSWCFYRPEMGRQLARRLEMGMRLEQALSSDALELYYQPQFDLDTRTLTGAEVLLRWTDPQWGALSPADFVPVAEERGLMGQLGEWVLRSACRQMQMWKAAGFELPGRLAVNVDARQFEDLEFVAKVRAIVEEASIDPEIFELEITESGVMADPERAVAVTEALQEAGFAIAIDDFGTGYSSLAYLKRFAVDTLKIDISFVRDMLSDGNDEAIVRTIIAMARSLGLATLAEGVETEAQAERPRALGCDFAQGFHFGRPEPAEAFAARWLARAGVSGARR
ncbi:MAG: PAS domain S-box protein [Pseudomonadota bacterium]